MEARTKALIERLGAKAGTQNIDRILRLPGTTNLPNAKKKRDGRVACPAKLLEFNKLAHPLDVFPLSAQPAANPDKNRAKLPSIDFDNLPDVDFSALRISNEIKAAIDSDGSDLGSGDRSAGVARVVLALTRAGCSDEHIASILWSEPIGAHCHDQPDPERAICRVIAFARKGDAANEFDTVKIAPDKAERHGVSRSDFYAYMPMHNYIYAPSRDTWPASSVNARVAPVPLVDANGEAVLDKNGKPATILAAAWLDRMRPVEQMTWAPGLPMIIRDRLISGGGWIERKGVSCFNLYRPPTIKPGNAAEVGPWIEHVHKVFPNDAEHIIKWLAHRVQRPDIKINHALVFGGDQGIGKDTILEPVKHAIGPWNFSEVSPQNMLGTIQRFLEVRHLAHK